MDTTFAALACCLLAFHFAVAQAHRGNLTVTPTLSTSLNQTNTTMMPITANSTTSHATVISNLTQNTTPFDSTTRDNDTFTKTIEASTESTSHLQTNQSTTITTTTPLTSHTSLTTGTPDTNTPTFTAPTTPVQQTTGVYVTSPDTIVTAANSSHTVNTTSDSMYRTTQGLGLNKSEINMTILFSVVLGVFAMALVVFMFHKCKHNIQYLHQPLTNTDATDTYVADEDTLVISGGLYDGHPIYDNVPTPPEEQSQFRLEFLQ